MLASLARRPLRRRAVVCDVRPVAIGSGDQLLPAPLPGGGAAVAPTALPIVESLAAGRALATAGPLSRGPASDRKRGGALAATAASLAYGAHLLWSWRGSPMANVDLVAVIGFYLFAGLAAGHLFLREVLRQADRDELIRRLYLVEQGGEALEPLRLGPTAGVLEEPGRQTRD